MKIVPISPLESKDGKNFRKARNLKPFRRL